VKVLMSKLEKVNGKLKKYSHVNKKVFVVGSLRIVCRCRSVLVYRCLFNRFLNVAAQFDLSGLISPLSF
jgi:hypothetical protein